MKLFKKKTNSIGEPLDKLVNGDLPFGWYAHNEQEIQKWEKPIPEMANAALHAETVNKQLQLLKELIDYYEKYRTYCYSKDDCWKKHFSDMWEHCHNSKCDDFNFIVPYKESLSTLLKNKEHLLRIENQRLSLHDSLIITIQSQPGILQTDVYKLFEKELKYEIADILYQWDKQKKIVREKHSSSYRIYLPQD